MAWDIAISPSLVTSVPARQGEGERRVKESGEREERERREREREREREIRCIYATMNRAKMTAEQSCENLYPDHA